MIMTSHLMTSGHKRHDKNVDVDVTAASVGM